MILSKKPQIIISIFFIVISLIYKFIMYNDLQLFKSTSYLVYNILISLVVVVTIILTRKHGKKPYILYSSYFICLILVSFFNN